MMEEETEFIEDQSMRSTLLECVTIEPGKCGGKRIRVSDIPEPLSGGASYDEILADYPFLEWEDFLAALEFAARQTDHIILQVA